MTRHYEQLLDEQRGQYQIIVDKTWEDLHPRQCFDESVTDIQELCEKIDAGYYDWFMLRTRVLFEGVELAEEYLGGCLYDDATEVLNDGTAEDQIAQALHTAAAQAAVMKKKFQELVL